MPDFERTPSSLSAPILCGVSGPLAVFLLYQKEPFYLSVPVCLLPHPCLFFSQFWKTVLGTTVVVGQLR